MLYYNSIKRTPCSQLLKDVLMDGIIVFVFIMKRIQLNFVLLFIFIMKRIQLNFVLLFILIYLFKDTYIYIVVKQ